jgi:uncharacterized alpha-E superfamily protein
MTTNVFILCSSLLFVFQTACRELKSLYLTNMNQVSDIGIRHILDGCHHIEHLHRRFYPVVYRLHNIADLLILTFDISY